MTALLLQKYNHPVKENSAQAAALFSVYDVIAIQSNNSYWGDQDLANPWFRIIDWNNISLEQAKSLLSSQTAKLNNKGMLITHSQIRANYLDLSHELLSDDFQQWWQDDTRKFPIYIMPDNIKLEDLIKIRPFIYKDHAVVPKITSITS